MKLKTTKYFKRVETDAMGFMLAKGVSRLYLSITLMVLGRTTISIDKVCKRAYAFFFYQHSNNDDQNTYWACNPR